MQGGPAFTRNLLSPEAGIHALLELYHPNLLGCIGVTVTPPFSIITRYVHGGQLFGAIKAQRHVSDAVDAICGGDCASP
jgi:formaldehyde-activating enzyme involved in methanogenesis